MNPIVLIPGFMGSQLARVRDQRPLWLDLVWTLEHLPEFLRELALTTPDDPGLAPHGVLETVNIKDLVKVGVYSELRQFVLDPSDGLGLDAGDYHEFAYDWRKSVAHAAVDLDAFLLGFPDDRPATLIAHSQGGLVVSQLFRLGGPGSARVGKVFALGCPFAGLLKTIDMIEKGSGILDLFFSHDPIRGLLRGLPGTYELMPSTASVPLFFDTNGNATTPYQEAQSFRSDRYDRGLLVQAGQIVGSPALAFPVPLRLVAGSSVKTAVSARMGANSLTVVHGDSGDGTCPRQSALAATGTALNGEKATATLEIDGGQHVELARDPRFFTFLKAELA